MAVVRLHRLAVELALLALVAYLAALGVSTGLRSSLDDVPAEIRAACGAVVDGGELPGVPSTVLDLTGDEPRVLREGAVPAAEALALVRRARHH